MTHTHLRADCLCTGISSGPTLGNQYGKGSLYFLPLSINDYRCHWSCGTEVVYVTLLRRTPSSCSCLTQHASRETDSFRSPWRIPPRAFPPPCSLRLELGVGLVRLGLVGLALRLWLGLGLWFGLGGKCPGGEMSNNNNNNVCLLNCWHTATILTSATQGGTQQPPRRAALYTEQKG